MTSENYSPHNQSTKNDLKSKDASQTIFKFSSINSRPQIPNTGSVVKKGL